MNRFDDLMQRVKLLNAQLGPVEHHLGSELRQLLHDKLWAVVEELNHTLNLGLDNTALDLTADGDCLRIHFWSEDGEVNIFIDRSFTVQRDKRDPTTGSVGPMRTPRA